MRIEFECEFNLVNGLRVAARAEINFGQEEVSFWHRFSGDYRGLARQALAWQQAGPLGLLPQTLTSQARAGAHERISESKS